MVDGDVTRTRWAAERTWLAWFRTGLATAVAALGVGRLAPVLVGGPELPYILLGVGYGALAVAIVLAAAARHRAMRRAIDEGESGELSGRWVLGVTVAVVILTLATLVVVIGSV